MTQHDWDDERLLREVVAAAAPPDVPEGVLHTALAVYTWRTIDAELAALAFDSALAPAFAADVRGDQATLRTLTFESRDIVLELELSLTGLAGQVVPAQRGTVEIRTLEAPQESIPVDVDGVGFFSVHPVPVGPFKLTLRTADGRSIVTPWISP